MEEMKAKLASVLSLQPLGAIAMADLARHYKQVNKEKLDFKILGFESLQKLLEAMPDTVQVKFDKKSSDYRVLLVNYEVNKAIDREINNQSQRPSSVDTSCSTKRYDKNDDWQSDSFTDRSKTSEDRPVNHLRQKPIPTAFRGQNDWDLYLQNFPNDTKENDLMDAFKSFGCTRIRIKRRENETLFGFATFREYSEAEMAYLTLDMTEFRGRPLNIQFAKSSIASEDEVRMRLEKTQFTAEVTSSRRRNFSSDNDSGSVDRRATARPDDFNWRRTKSQVDASCHSPLRRDDSSWLPWEPFAAPGYTATEEETTTCRQNGRSTRTRDTVTSNTNQSQAAQGKASCIKGDNISDTAELYCDRKRRAQSNSTRTVQVFADTDVDAELNSKEDAEAVANLTTETEEDRMEQFDSRGKQNKTGRHYSSESNDSTKSGRVVQMFADTKVGGKQSNSIEAHEPLDKSINEHNDNEEQIDSIESEEKTERLDSFSIGDKQGQLDSPTKSDLHCTTDRRSIDSQEIRSRPEIPDKIVMHSTSIQDSEAGISKDIRDGKDNNECPLLNRISDISLSETKNDSSLSSDNRDARIEEIDANIELPVSGRIDPGRANSETENCAKENKENNEEDSSILSQTLKTTSEITPTWLRVYVRDDVLLVEDILKWIKIYSRNEQNLGQLKYQCRPLTQFKKPSLPDSHLSFNIANSLKATTETVISESLSVEADTLSTSNTSIPQVDSLLGRCCEKIPETMDVQFLQKMLQETRLTQGFLSQRDLPDTFDLIVIHVCNSDHFWGSVVNPGAFMEEYEDLCQMMNDIAEKARPEFQLDKAAAGDKRAGVMYEEIDWCRVWVRSETVRNSKVEVFYVDYGNTEYRSIDDLWVLPRKAWDLRPMVLPFHLTGSLAKKTLFEMVNTKIKVKLIRSQPPALDFVVAVRPYREIDSVDIE